MTRLKQAVGKWWLVALLLFLTSTSFAMHWQTGTEVGEENAYARIAVSPHTSTGLITQTQYLNITSKVGSAQTVNVTFYYDRGGITNPHIWLWQNYTHNVTIYTAEIYDCSYSTMDNETNETGYVPQNCTQYVPATELQSFYDWKNYDGIFQGDVFAGKQAYTALNVPFSASESKYVKIQYDTPIGAGGKYNVVFYKGGPTQLAAGTANIILELDPWWNSTWSSYREIDVVCPSCTNGAPAYFNVTAPIVVGSEVRFTTNSSGTETECGGYWKVDNVTSEEYVLNCTLLNGSAINPIRLYFLNTSAVTDIRNISKSCGYLGDHMDSGAGYTTRIGTPVFNNSILTLTGTTNEEIQSNSVISPYKKKLWSFSSMTFAASTNNYLGFYNHSAGNHYIFLQTVNAASHARTGNTTETDNTVTAWGAGWQRYEIIWNFQRADFRVNATTHTITGSTVDAMASPVEHFIAASSTVEMTDWDCVLDDFGAYGYNATFSAWITPGGVVAVLSPKTNTWTSDTTPEITYNISGAAATRCWYSAMGGAYTELTGQNATGQHLFNTSAMAEGLARNVTVTCESYGENSSASILVNIDTGTPWILINSPADGTFYEQHSGTSVPGNYTLYDSIAASAQLNSTLSLNGNASNAGSADWCNASFEKKTLLTVVGTIPEDDYQVNFTTSHPEDLGCLQANYSDIRVYSWDGAACSARPFDITASNSIFLAIVINATNASGTAHYIYCGNVTVDSMENPGHTYLFFDDYPDAAVSTSRWSLNGSAYIDIYLGAMQFYSPDAFGVKISAKPNMTMPTTYQLDFRQSARDDIGELNRVWLLNVCGTGTNCAYIWNDITHSYAKFFVNTSSTTRAIDTAWHNETIIYNGSHIFMYEDGVLKASDQLVTANGWIFGSTYQTNYAHQLFDDVRMRKYSASQPEFNTGTSENYIAANSGAAMNTHTLASNGSNYQETLSTLLIGWNNISAAVVDDFHSNSTNISVYMYAINFGGFIDSNIINGSTENIYIAISTQGAVNITGATAHLRLWNGTNESVAGALQSGDGLSGVWNFSWVAPANGNGQVNYTVEAFSNATLGTTSRNSSQDYFGVDELPPALDCALGNATNFITPSYIWFSCNATDTMSSISSVAVYVNGTPYWLNHFPGNAWNGSILFRNTSYGDYSIYAVALDSAGNANTTSTATFTTSKVVRAESRSMDNVNFTLSFPANYSFNATVHVTYGISYVGTSTAMPYNETYLFPETIASNFSCNSTACTANSTIATFAETTVAGGQSFIYEFNYTVENFTMRTSTGAAVRYVNISMPDYSSGIGGDMLYLKLSFLPAETWTGDATDYLRIRTYDEANSQWVNLNLNPSGGSSSGYGIHDYHGYDANLDGMKDTANISLDLHHANFSLEFEKQGGAETGYSPPPPPGGGGGSSITNIYNTQNESIVPPPDITIGEYKIDDFLKRIDGWMKEKPNGLLLFAFLGVAYVVKREENISALFAFGLIVVVALYWSVLL